jgi:hypothetical protein
LFLSGEYDSLSFQDDAYGDPFSDEISFLFSGRNQGRFSHETDLVIPTMEKKILQAQGP